MCLAAVAFDAHPNYLAVVLANRDEFHARPAAPLALWHDRPNILAGRDLQAGGTWMGLEQRSRFGLVTNFRESLKMPQAPTRGDLVPDFLTSSNSAESHLGTPVTVIPSSLGDCPLACMRSVTICSIPRGPNCYGCVAHYRIGRVTARQIRLRCGTHSLIENAPRSIDCPIPVSAPSGNRSSRRLSCSPKVTEHVAPPCSCWIDTETGRSKSVGTTCRGNRTGKSAGKERAPSGRP